jgi:hypothetical protein
MFRIVYLLFLQVIIIIIIIARTPLCHWACRTSYRYIYVSAQENSAIWGRASRSFLHSPPCGRVKNPSLLILWLPDPCPPTTDNGTQQAKPLSPDPPDHPTQAVTCQPSGIVFSILEPSSQPTVAPGSSCCFSFVPAVESFIQVLSTPDFGGIRRPRLWWAVISNV